MLAENMQNQMANWQNSWLRLIASTPTVWFGDPVPDHLCRGAAAAHRGRARAVRQWRAPRQRAAGGPGLAADRPPACGGVRALLPRPEGVPPDGAEGAGLHHADARVEASSVGQPSK